MSSSVKKKLLSCLFFDDVLCSYHTAGDDFRPMERCFTCSHYLRFIHEMEEEEERVHAEFDRIRKYGYPKDIGELES